MSKMLSIFWNTIGDRTFKITRDEFIRIKFRRIRRKSIAPNLIMFFKKFFNRFSPMNCTAIPK